MNRVGSGAAKRLFLILGWPRAWLRLDVIPFPAYGFWNWEAETISLRYALIYVLANTGLLVDFDPSRASRWNERHTTCI
jgi:hypothetical protein